MKTINIEDKNIARRGLNSISSSILCLLYEIYPCALTIRQISKKLNVREVSIKSSIRKIIASGVPLEKIYEADTQLKFKSNPSEPIYWIIKEKQSAIKMLDIISDIQENGNSHANEKRDINSRIYKEYISTLDELFDKWTSLRLFDQLDNEKY